MRPKATLQRVAFFVRAVRGGEPYAGQAMALFAAIAYLAQWPLALKVLRSLPVTARQINILCYHY